ncbi:MAG: DegT/DnrJ/EryC1/StrS family aminotransferase, partial [Cytophaga sp.]|uniref:DegT/DnrJ/EryC1/StrS family aminotransferase n=1 Tax=Cytophaga sp. TaxID=29535 RepID=UPI003F81EF81
HGIDNAWLTCIELPVSVTPDHIISSLEKENIESRRLWNPMHNQPAFKQYNSYRNGCSDSIFGRGLCVPSGTGLVEKDIIHITDIMKRSL